MTIKIEEMMNSLINDELTLTINENNEVTKIETTKQMVGETTIEFHQRMKVKLLQMAKDGEPKPEPDSELGKLLTAFTTKG